MPTDLAVQTALVIDLTTSQTAAAARRGEALTTRRDAWRAFETAIYGDASKPAIVEVPRRRLMKVPHHTSNDPPVTKSLSAPPPLAPGPGLGRERGPV